MSTDWEQKQEQLIRRAECLPELDSALRRRVLMGAAVAKRSAVRRQRLAIAAGVLMFVGSGTFAVSRVLTTPQSAPIVESTGEAPDATDDGLYDQAIDRQAERTQVFPASMLP